MRAFQEEIEVLSKPVIQHVNTWVTLQAQVIYDYDTFAVQHGIVALRALAEHLLINPMVLKLGGQEQKLVQAMMMQFETPGLTYSTLQKLISNLLQDLRPGKGKWLFDIAWTRGLVVEAILAIWPKIQQHLSGALQHRVLVPKLKQGEQHCAIVTAQQTQRLLSAKESIQSLTVKDDPSLAQFLSNLKI